MEFWEVEQQFRFWRAYPPLTDLLMLVHQVKPKPKPQPMSFEAFERLMQTTGGKIPGVAQR